MEEGKTNTGKRVGIGKTQPICQESLIIDIILYDTTHRILRWLLKNVAGDSAWSQDCAEFGRLYHLLDGQCNINRTLQLDLDRLYRAFSLQYRSFFRFLSGSYWRDSRLVRGVMKRSLGYAETVEFLSQACNLRKILERIIRALNWCLEVKRLLSGSPMSERFVSLVSSGNSMPPSAASFTSAYQQAISAISELKKHFEEGWPRFQQIPLAECSFDQVYDGTRTMLGRLESLRDWVDLKRIRDEFAAAGHEDLLSALEKRVPPTRVLVEVVEKAFLESWVDEVFSKDPALCKFRTEEHEKLIKEFKTLDEKHWRVGPYRVINAVNKRIPDPSTVYDGGELQVLQREANKMRRLMPIRKLFERIPNLLLKIKPALLMSPLSVSQFLNPKVLSFDLVIFDEASQICAEDAAGAIYRGRQLVVCGDDKQLPPTAFFQMGMAEDDYYDDSEEKDAAAEYESVLEACRGAGLPVVPLRWHYRSKDESLIAFSNRQFYDYSLVTFPSCLYKR